jgi:Lipopolysaccharide kinase (Kdo/WaaP) family
VNASAIVAPNGYERFEVGSALVVARVAAAAGLRSALHGSTTLHDWAASVPGAEPFQGRATAWGVRLPGAAIDVVVRHAQRGGLLAGVRGDRFVWPGRAPWELETALRLQDAGVRTPDVVAFALYPAGPGRCRCDAATRRLPPGAEFPVSWRAAAEDERDTMLGAIGTLLRDLRSAGAQHADLNAKNLYLARDGGRWHAWVLDVDRVRFGTGNDAGIGEQNLARLDRSLRKLRERDGLEIDDTALARLSELAGPAA